ncbi:MAG TPA: hypothetical protein GX693_02545, partial [Firmicutes bacterium]|nr:hypothetical protein [Bacillota bacterium]
NRGGRKLADSSGDLLYGMREFVNSTAKISSAAGVLSGGLSQLDQGCSQLQSSVLEISQTAGELAGGLVAGVSSLENISASALALATELSEKYSDESVAKQFQELLGLLQVQQMIIEGTDETTGLSAGADQLQAGLNGLAQGSQVFASEIDQQLLPGLGQIAENTTRLAAGAKEIHDGTRELTRAGRKLYRGTAEYLQGVDELSGGLEEFNDGILEMDREINRLKDIEMVDTEGKSLDDIEYSLQESLEELRLGKSAADQMEILAGQYVSFMDNYRNKDSNVQFIMKTKAIENKLPPGPSAEDTDKPRKSFWQKLKELFS